jgi:hypothetical protein
MSVMNKKIFALLLILPVGFFAADKVLGHSTPGGGKEKSGKKQSAKNEAQAKQVGEGETALSYQSDVTQQTNATATELPIPTKTSADAQKALLGEIAALKTAFDQEGEEYKRYNDADQVWLGDERISEEARALLEAKVMTPLEVANLFGISLKESFSRCPSGYHITVIADENNLLTNEGYMVRDQGCWDRPIARYRYDVATQEVAVLVSDKTSIGLGEFFRLYKKAS